MPKRHRQLTPAALMAVGIVLVVSGPVVGVVGVEHGLWIAGIVMIGCGTALVTMGAIRRSKRAWGRSLGDDEDDRPPA